MINGNEGNDETSFKQRTGPTNKRKDDDLEKGGEDKKRWIENSNQIEEFRMKEGEEWEANFCGKCAEAQPIWKGKVKMCVRWNTKGGCFKDCKHGESHVSANQISGEKRAEYLAYLNKVRGD
eukprot:12399346-Ditylum_brightwellii.AAC.1